MSNFDKLQKTGTVYITPKPLTALHYVAVAVCIKSLCCCVKAKFHYAIWFEPAPNQLA